MNGLYSYKANLTLFQFFRSFTLFSSCLYFKGMFQSKFDMAHFYFNVMKENSKSVTRVYFAMLYELNVGPIV